MCEINELYVFWKYNSDLKLHRSKPMYGFVYCTNFFFVIFVNPIEKRVTYEKNYTNNNANECSLSTKGLQYKQMASLW